MMTCNEDNYDVDRVAGWAMTCPFARNLKDEQYLKVVSVGLGLLDLFLLLSSVEKVLFDPRGLAWRHCHI